MLHAPSSHIDPVKISLSMPYSDHYWNNLAPKSVCEIKMQEIIFQFPLLVAKLYRDAHQANISVMPLKLLNKTPKKAILVFFNFTLQPNPFEHSFNIVIREDFLTRFAHTQFAQTAEKQVQLYDKSVKSSTTYKIDWYSFMPVVITVPSIFGALAFTGMIVFLIDRLSRRSRR